MPVDAAAAPALSSLLSLLLVLVLPVLLVTLTSFIKISVVFSILRNALGAPDVPSGLVVTALSLVLSAYVMAPVASQVQQSVVQSGAVVQWDSPLVGPGSEALQGAIAGAFAPVGRFLQKHSGERERALFLELARRDPGVTVGEDDFFVLWPSFLITELSEAFRIGFVVFLPFLVLDLFVANAILALGLSSLSAASVSFPLKLLLFVAVDGWLMISRALVLGYG